MNITDKIAKHYQASIGGELQKYECKEWDCDIYYRTTYPLKDESKILELQSQGKTVEALVESVVTKARTKDGKRMFHDADRIKLMNEADPQTVLKVATAINNAKVTATQESISKE
jgi:hypothetical protein|tara:strand:- start:1806 stop:2150 length:345 start_codon:yes stop_codon:yes gene_type:complete